MCVAVARVACAVHHLTFLPSRPHPQAIENLCRLEQALDSRPSAPALSDWLLAALFHSLRLAYASPPVGKTDLPNAALELAVALLSSAKPPALSNELPIVRDVVELIRGHPVVEVGEGMADPKDVRL